MNNNSLVVILIIETQELSLELTLIARIQHFLNKITVLP